MAPNDQGKQGGGPDEGNDRRDGGEPRRPQGITNQPPARGGASTQPQKQWLTHAAPAKAYPAIHAATDPKVLTPADFEPEPDTDDAHCRGEN